MPIVDMLFDPTANNYMDCFSGYNHILLKTAFRCPSSIRTFEWMPMPFSLKNASATDQRAMNTLFHDMLGHDMEVYIGDIVVKSKRANEHPDHLRRSFEGMRHHQLKLNPLKCAFGVHARHFLRFLVHQRGIEVDQNKSKVIASANAPQNKKELQKLLGQVNYVRRFSSNLAGKTKEFSNLVKLKDMEEFTWEKQHQVAFHKIKEYLLNLMF